MSYYKTPHWESLRALALKQGRYKCASCGQLCLGRKRNGVSPFIDHIKPRPKSPHPTPLDVLANLQVLCHTCHNKKTMFDDNNDTPEIGSDGFPVDGEW